ncbi:hypothetical protein [Candidatus Aciduliprofundum boonei]|uniref:Viral A-type inclusion protein repeat containing protein n=1 Tax=Aciduliprofundum boonei (strain DSM 19572 / T469) TaxID=439481 RepID=B5IDK1_ACIB4|nr:hypothetical protein [Candidatus Aciduliprofundum boonei]ADD08076.1 Viral A-type inclusion protein repeat containing protein [Aciduliprofundum boonei T469]EDY35622.1 hypothetical protein ABOONEI_159 [Aciduliprofundum boonei T469]HII54504.1 hypothetical protein [Candidatus Aciduliprofundum boonei]
MENLNNSPISKYLNDIPNKKLVEELLKIWEKKLKLVEEIESMNLPVDDWDKMEEEIIGGAVE